LPAPTAAATSPRCKQAAEAARRPIMQSGSEDAFEQAALAALDGGSGAAGGLAGGLRLAQPLLLLLGIDDDAGRRLVPARRSGCR
jgi:hypothetical protein